MKIVQESQSVIILKDRRIWAYVVGVIFALIGLAIIRKDDFITNQPPAGWGYGGVLIGVFIVVAIKNITISLDKIANKVLFSRQGLIGKDIKEYNLDQVKEVEMSVDYSTKGYSYHLAFVFNNNEVVPFDPGSSSVIRVMGKQIIPEKNLGVKVASFLNVPFQERRPPTISETLSTISSTVQDVAEKEIEKRKTI